MELTEKRINEMVEGLGIIAALPDPIGEIKSMWRRPNGLEIGKMCVPLGVIGIIYEARPNVTVDAAALTIKSGNSVVLRGSSEAIVTNRLLVSIIQEGLQKTNLPPNAVVLIEDTSRQAAQELMRMNGYLDVLIPRGGPSLIKTVLDNATVPVIETGSGNCHIYVDKSAELKMAANIIFNAKTQRPGVCNAVETLLVHKDIYSQLLPDVIKQLTEAGVEIYGCPRTMSLSQEVKPATEKDWQTEYL
ncbi:MAG: glutamate-5-semialdehyde dehydrogenase, partial [Firmicutes bacterium]|nr:glutamate-5-semialdehyde dehydrogenase [Bacillota bacterium]